MAAVAYPIPVGDPAPVTSARLPDRSKAAIMPVRLPAPLLPASSAGVLRRLGRMPGISRDEVAHLARLARLDLEPQELDHYAEQLDVILSAVARVGEVAADDVEPMSHPVALGNVLRPDERRPCLTPQEALSAAPAVEEQRFRVPRILDEE